MRVLVFGGRDFADKVWLYEVMDRVHRWRPIGLVIEGEARGADKLARMWAEDHNIPVQQFPADWNKYGNRAGPIRNQQMLDEGRPDIGVAFPGGRGTADMTNRARESGIKVYEMEKGK